MRILRWLFVCTLIAFVQLRDLLPAKLIYRHDWAWPITSQQLLAARWQNEAPWNLSGTGDAALSPLHHPLFIVWSIGGSLLGPQLTLFCTLLVAFALFGAGVAACSVRLWKLSGWMAGLIGIVGQLGVPLMNKLSAGHTYYLVSVAAFVWLLYAVLEAERKQTWPFIAAGVFAGFTVLQYQIYAVALAVLIFACFRNWRSTPGWRIGGIVIALSQFFPILLAAVGHDAPAAYAPMKPQRLWEWNNSAPLPDGLYLLGYAPRYAEAALHQGGTWSVAIVVLQIAILLSFIAVGVRWRSRAAFLLLLGWGLSVLLVLGLYGPLGNVLSFAFSHISAMAVFRELYHFAGIAWVCQLLLLTGVAVNSFSRVCLTGYLSVAALTLGAMWLPPNLGSNVVRFDVPQPLVQALERVRASKGDSRFLLWPAEWPVGPKTQSISGNDPAAYPIGSHPVANSFRLGPAVEVAAALVREGKAQDAQRWFSSAGVSTIITEPWLSARLDARAPQTRNNPPWIASLMIRAKSENTPSTPTATCLLCAYAGIPVVNEPEDWHVGESFIKAEDLARGAFEECGILLPFDQADSPATGWKTLSDWWWLDSRLAMLGNGVITWGEVPLKVAPCGADSYFAHVLVLSGSLYVDASPQNASIGRPVWIHLRPGSHALSVKSGVVAIGSIVTHVPVVSENEHIDVRRTGMLMFNWKTGQGSGSVSRDTKWIVLKTSYSQHWRLALSDGAVLKHIVASGYANAWEVRIRRQSAVRVWYDRWSLTETFATLACCVWWGGAALVFLARYRRRSVNAVA